MRRVTTPTTIMAGDRIGMTVVSGGSPLHAIVDNLSPFPAPGVYPSTPPDAEPATGDSYDFISSAATGPLIRGTSPPRPAEATPRRPALGSQRRPAAGSRLPAGSSRSGSRGRQG